MPVNSGARPEPPGGHSTQWPQPLLPARLPDDRAVPPVEVALPRALAPPDEPAPGDVVAVPPPPVVVAPVVAAPAVPVVVAACPPVGGAIAPPPAG